MTLIVLAVLAADPHTALIVPERLASLDQHAAKIARDIAKEDRLYRQLDATFEKLRAKPDAGVKPPDKNLAEWDDQKAVLRKLHSELDDDVASVRALKSSKTPVTVDAARAVGDELDGLDGKVQDLRNRLERLLQAIRQPVR